jgi:hypothetical protein
MIDFCNQQIRDGLGPVFQPPDTGYDGRACASGKFRAGKYDIDGKEFAVTELPPSAREILAASAEDLAPRGYDKIYLPRYGWEPGKDDPLDSSSLTIPEGRLCMCIKNKDLPEIGITRAGKTEMLNNTNIVWAYREGGKTFISTTLLGYAPRRETEGDKRPQLAIQNGGY